jgi:iduronate 2-sulfatase
LESPEHLQGNSLVPLFENPEIDWKKAVFTEWPLSPRKDPEKVISGFTIRTEDHRYVEWTRKNTGEVLARELYDHLADPDENINIAALPESESLVDSLSLILDGGKGWK